MSTRFFPSRWSSGYRIPPKPFDWLEGRLRRFRRSRREAAHKLAAFLGQYQTGPDNYGRAFPCDRRALAREHPELGTEWKIRGAIETLQEVGWLERQEGRGSLYKRELVDGEPHRKPIMFRIGAEFRRLLEAVFAYCNNRKANSPKGNASLSQFSFLFRTSSPAPSYLERVVPLGELERAGQGTPLTTSPDEQFCNA